MIKITAYMLNNYYIFTDFSDLSSLIHDILHHSESITQNDDHSFSIIKGNVHWDKMEFTRDSGEIVPLKYEDEYDLYYSTLED